MSNKIWIGIVRPLIGIVVQHMSRILLLSLIHIYGDFYYVVQAVDASGNASEPAKVRTNSVVEAVDLSILTATAGNSNSSSEDASKVLDNDTSTIWHTDWDGISRDQQWIDIHFATPTEAVSYTHLICDFV